MVCIPRHDVPGIESRDEQREFELHGHFGGEAGVVEDGVGGEDVFVCEAGEVVYGDIAVGTDDDGFNGGGHGGDVGEGVGRRGRIVGGHGGGDRTGRDMGMGVAVLKR